MSACECAQCGAVFTGLTAFDAHQDVDYRRRPAVVCRPPATCGLVLNRHGRWGQRQTPQGAARLAALMESRAGVEPAADRFRGGCPSAGPPGHTGGG